MEMYVSIMELYFKITCDFSQILEKAAHVHVCNYYGIYVHVLYIAFVTILYYGMYFIY